MFTALISAALLGLLALCGVKLSVAQIAGVVIGVKIVVVATIFASTALYYRGKPKPGAAVAPAPGPQDTPPGRGADEQPPAAR